MEAIQKKCDASGTANFRERELDCSLVLRSAFKEYQQNLRSHILSLPDGSKEWWKLNRELINRKTKQCSIPPLKTPSGEWILEPAAKAELLAGSFQSKSKLPDAVADPEPIMQDVDVGMSEFMLIRSRWVLKVLRALDVNKATGPDDLPARILKECAHDLAVALAILIRFLLRMRCWPQLWRFHKIHPLFKKGSHSNPFNYRGVHLTNVISKVVERVIGLQLTAYFERVGAYGGDQWVFRQNHSCRDLVTLLVTRWIWAMDSGFKVAIYLSDIAGAFDRVDRSIIVARLRSVGLSKPMVDFLFQYLAPRVAAVIVQGKSSTKFTIEDEIFQGTVLGPPLWNVFFEPVDTPIRSCSFQPAKFADDLTASKNFESSTSNAAINAQLHEVQQVVHDWGSQNRVTFDAAKEHCCILHKLNCEGDVFKLLGVLIDTNSTCIRK